MEDGWLTKLRRLFSCSCSQAAVLEPSSCGAAARVEDSALSPGPSVFDRSRPGSAAQQFIGTSERDRLSRQCSLQGPPNLVRMSMSSETAAANSELAHESRMSMSGLFVSQGSRLDDVAVKVDDIMLGEDSAVRRVSRRPSFSDAFNRRSSDKTGFAVGTSNRSNPGPPAKAAHAQKTNIMKSSEAVNVWD